MSGLGGEALFAVRGRNEERRISPGAFLARIAEPIRAWSDTLLRIITRARRWTTLIAYPGRETR